MSHFESPKEIRDLGYLGRDVFQTTLFGASWPGTLKAAIGLQDKLAWIIIYIMLL